MYLYLQGNTIVPIIQLNNAQISSPTNNNIKSGDGQGHSKTSVHQQHSVVDMFENSRKV